ncbi:MAG: TIGR01212 family radical SAM protein [Culicoidibacterales bacterium]
MQNPFPYSLDNKRYHTWNYHLREIYGEKVFKVSLNAGFTCPNIDGKTTYGGCTFCSTKGSGDFAGNPADELVDQFVTIRNRTWQKWPDVTKFIGYFQAFSNTYAPVDVLRDKYEAILALDGVVGLSIATRPDCLEDDVIDYLAELNTRTNLWIELGLQSMHESTAKLINRGHDLPTFITAVEKLRSHNINVCVHIINGLPRETPQMMMETAQLLANMDIQGVKIHLLHVLKNTAMAKMLEKNMMEPMTREDYVQVVCDQLEIFAPEVIMHRVTGDGGESELIAPLWSLKKFVVMNEIDKELVHRDSWQGKKYLKR